jgi:hypothetical protein
MVAKPAPENPRNLTAAWVITEFMVLKQLNIMKTTKLPSEQSQSLRVGKALRSKECPQL